jgi:hypothetical protein
VDGIAGKIDDDLNHAACAAELKALAGKLPDIPVLVGHPLEEAGKRFNAVTLLGNGKMLATYRKQQLPNAEVCCQLPKFEEALEIVEIADGKPLPGVFVAEQPTELEVYRALVLGVRDYLGKNGFAGADDRQQISAAGAAFRTVSDYAAARLIQPTKTRPRCNRPRRVSTGHE